jgi:hypothetical protein
MNRRKTTEKNIKELKKEIVPALLMLASSSYTASAARQIIDLSAWLLDKFRTEEEVVKYLAVVIDEIIPHYLPQLIKNSKSLSKYFRSKKAKDIDENS